MKSTIAFLAFLLSLSGHSQVTVTYTGNMGVLVADEKTSVWVDGLHEEYGKDYLFPTDSLITRITNGKNFIVPTLLLYTHKHGDHFSSELTNAFIKKNDSCFVLAPSQVIASINFSKKTKIVATDTYKKQHFNYGKIALKAFKIDHAGERHKNIENTGYLFTIGDKVFLHVGDTDWYDEKKLWDKLDLKNEGIDVAFLPYWMLLKKDTIQTIEEHLPNTIIVATHISPRISVKELTTIKNKFPKFHFLTSLEQQITF